ncbi:MAG: response regulator [Gemmatimonadota bacterium]
MREEREEDLPRTVLVADDEASMRDLLGACLKLAGVRVHTARDGRDALAVARALRPEAVLLDLMMPYLDGLEVCRLLRADPNTRSTTVVLCSASDERDVDWRGAGADAYLAKPFSLPRVPEAIRLAHRAARAP